MNSCHGRSIWQYTFSPAGLPWWFSDKESTNARDGGDASSVFPWVGKILWRRAWQPIPVLLPGKSHEQRSLVGYSPWSHKESDTTWHACIHSCFVLLTCVYSLIKNGSLRIIKLLEKWRVSDLTFSPIHPLRLWTSSTKPFQIILIPIAIYGVAQSWTRLKQQQQQQSSITLQNMYYFMICLIYYWIIYYLVYHLS